MLSHDVVGFYIEYLKKLYLPLLEPLPGENVEITPLDQDTHADMWSKLSSLKVGNLNSGISENSSL